MNKKTIKFTRGDGILEGFLAKKRAEMANKLIPPGKRSGRILDIGCGSYPFFLDNCVFAEKFGIDKSLVKIHNDKSLNLKKFDFEVKKLPFFDDYFDAVTMLAVFEHINKESLVFVLKEVRRVLKKDGIFIITTPSPWADKLLHFMAKFGLISKEEIHDHKHNLFPDRVSEFLIKSGFSEERIKHGFFEASFNMWFKAKK